MQPDFNSFGPITLYSGLSGSGMTLASVVHAVELKKQIPSLKIFSSYPLYRLEFTLFNFEDLLNYCKEPGEPILVVMDPGYYYLDNRSTQTKVNRLITYLVSRTRRWDARFIITSPSYNKKEALHHIDKRVRERVNTHLRVSTYKSRQGEVKSLLIGSFRVPRVYEYFKYFNSRDLSVNPRINKGGN